MLKSILFLAALIGLSVAFGALRILTALEDQSDYMPSGTATARIWARLTKQLAAAESPGKAQSHAER